MAGVVSLEAQIKQRLQASRQALAAKKTEVLSELDELRKASAQAPVIMGSGARSDAGLDPAGRESVMGIEAFLGSHPGFTGWVKRRNCDFVVKEVTPGGEVAALTDLSLPVFKGAETDWENLEELELLFGPGKWAELKQNFASDGPKEPMLFDVHEKSKEERMLMHKAVRALGAEMKLNSSTIDGEDGRKKLSVTKYKKGDVQNRQWPPDLPKFLHAVMYTEGMDTQSACSLIAKQLRLPQNIISFAGSKDKAAIVTQRISLSHVKAEKLAQINVDNLKRNEGQLNSRLVVGNFSYAKEPIRLGDSIGNQFTIVIRDFKGDPEPGLKSMSDKGFINYFGLQRFGTTSIPTQAIGKALFACDWAQAVDLLLKPRDGKEEREMQEMRKQWEATKNPGKTLMCLPKKGRYPSSLEWKVLDALRKAPGNFHAALGNLPRSMRQMYCHAYQSYIWNKTVSKRIADHGTKVLAGDLVFIKPDFKPPAEEDSSSTDSPKEEPKSVTDNAEHRNSMRSSRLAAVAQAKADSKKRKKEDSQDASETCSKKPRSEDSEEHQPSENEKENKVSSVDQDASNAQVASAKSRKSWVRHLSEEEAASGNFSISSVLVPIPGYDVAYPDNATLEYMETFLKADKFSVAKFQDPKKDKFIDSPGNNIVTVTILHE
ncbi:unnamed protein product [Notodromas monacha]|uniref:TRUD domain-containing protein n=1 Tax=Notodromas monacha TaxID=399045 RepID=A0A7R9BKV6_9CRUS|nr:unnamed protein product [Notodromas monacha]CAG0916031.1 unnamed protein product [Notodromas monacha]